MRLKFEPSELEMEALNERRKRDPMFSRFLSNEKEYNKTKILKDMINSNRVDTHNIFEYYGPTGSTKSYSMLNVSALIDPMLIDIAKSSPEDAMKQVFFETSVFSNNMRTFKDGCCVNLDEQTKEYGAGKDRIITNVMNFYETIRKRKISLQRASPIRKDYISYALSHWIFECFRGFIDKENQIAKVALQTNRGLTMGYVLMKHPVFKLGDEFMKLYEKKKDDFTFKMMGKDDSGGEIAKKAKAIYNCDEMQKMIQTYAKITNDDIYSLVDDMHPELKYNIEHFIISKRVRTMIKKKYPQRLYGVLQPGQEMVINQKSDSI